MAHGSAIMKVGPWGATRGTPRDINSGSNPVRLRSITVHHNNVLGGRIYAFSFEYVDQRGTPIPIGPWGVVAGLVERIDLQPGDYVNHLSGTTDTNGVTSLKIVTSRGVEYQCGYPPQSGSTTFSVPLNEINGGEAISFFGISGASSLAALGVYVTGERQVVKMGAWGPPQGQIRDINLSSSMPRHLLSVTIYSSVRVNGFSFVYVDQNGQNIEVPTCGSNQGQRNQFNMAQGEFVNRVSGTTDDYGVTSLTFSTTTGGQYGPYGTPDDATNNSFSVPLQQGTGAALSFFGRSDRNYITAFGTYVGPRAA